MGHNETKNLHYIWDVNFAFSVHHFLVYSSSPWLCQSIVGRILDCNSLPEGPKNLTINSLSPPRIVTSCLLSILWRQRQRERERDRDRERDIMYVPTPFSHRLLMYLTKSRARGSLVVLHLLSLHTQLRSIFTETDNPIGYSPAVDVTEIERGRTWDNKDAI